MNKYIYILKCNNFYKIGIASNVKERIRQLQTGNPYPIEVKNVFEVEEKWIGKFEQRLHNFAKDMNIQGEWFELSDNYLNGVISMCNVAQTYSAGEE